MKKLLLMIVVATYLQAETISVVVSKNFHVTELSKSQVKRIFLSKTNTLNSSRVQVYEIKDTTSKKEFYKKVLGKSLGQLRSYWARLIYTGKAQPPKQLENVRALITKMQEDKNVISYVSTSKITTDMKVVYTMGE